MAEITNLYKHYKGGVYVVVGLANHTETGELLVVYHEKNKRSYRLWVRPIDMFFGEVLVNGEMVKRFEPYVEHEK